MPPNGLLFSRTYLAMYSYAALKPQVHKRTCKGILTNLSNKVPSSIETESHQMSLRLAMYAKNAVRTLVDNQCRSIKPSFSRKIRFFNPTCKRIGRFLSQSNGSKRMYSAATDVKTCNSGRGGDSNGLRHAIAQQADNLSEKNRFPGPCSKALALRG